MPDWTIQTIDLRLCHLQPRRTNCYSDGSRDPDQFPVIVVQITADGISGYGEFLPTSLFYPPGHAGRSEFDEWQTLAEACEKLIGSDARALDRLVPEALLAYDANSLVDGISFALHDLVGRLAGLPVWALLGGCVKPSAIAMTVVHTATPAEMVERAREYHALSGYRWLKLKPIGNLDADRETMMRIRSEIDSQMRFVIDPNDSLQMNAQQVVNYINALQPHGLEICEDPIPADWDTYRWIQEQTDVAMMIDAKSRTLEAVLEIVNHRCARLINIHANWAGGFRAALRKAQLAALGGIETMVGSTYYSGIGVAAYQTLSAVVPGRHLCEQTNASEDVVQIAVRNEYNNRNGRIEIPDAPGFGIEIDKAKLESLTVDHLRIGR